MTAAALFGALVAFLLSTSRGFAQVANVIGVNFTFQTSYESKAVTLAASDIAGAVPVTNWLNYMANTSWPATQGTNNIHDSTGANTGAGLTMSGVNNGWYNTASIVNSASAPNTRLLHDLLVLRSGGTQTYTFTNLPAIGNYDVYVYLSGQDNADEVGVRCTTDGVSYYQTAPGAVITNNQVLVQGNNTASGTYPDCNYVVFGGVTPAANAISFVVTNGPSPGDNGGVAGVQLVPSGTKTVSTWTNKLGGSWGAAVNWNGGAIASGSGNTADFSTLTSGTSPIVTLDGTRTIGNMIFGDEGNTYGWTLSAGSGDPLALAVGNGSPIVTVNNQTTTISAGLAGTAGMIKTGAGTLSLAVEEGSLSGVIVVSNGALQLSANPGDDGNGTLGNSAITVYGPGELQFNAGDVSGYDNASALTLIGGDMRQVSAYSETLGRPITLDNGTITANSGAGAFNHPPHLNGDCYNQNGDLLATAANSTNYISMPAGTQFSLRGGSFSNAANSVLMVNGVLDDFATGAFGPQSLVKGGPGSMILNSNNTYTGSAAVNGGDAAGFGAQGASGIQP